MPASRAGFSVLEMLIVLAIMGLSVALVMPAAGTMMDRMVARSVFFDFQRQISDLRRQAYADQAPAVISDGRRKGPAVALRAGWTYTLSEPIQISEGGACSRSRVTILNGRRPVIHLAPAEEACRFIRLD